MSLPSRPVRVFDAHLHIVDPRFPLVANSGYVPDPFTADDYVERVKPLPVVGGAVVSGSFQAFDTAYLVDALERLGEGFVGVTNLPAEAPDEEVLRLDAAGVRAVRVNLFRGGSATLGELDRLSRRVHDVAGWHTELYLDAADLPELLPVLTALPQVTIDHLGMRDAPGDELLRLVEGGTVVKATGFGRIEVVDPGRLVRQILDVAPHGLVFGTDLPSTRARVPYTHADVERLLGWLADDEVEAVMAGNARRLYRL